MSRRVEVLDTSIIVNLLKVPGKHDEADQIEREFEKKKRAGVTFYLPVAAVVESAHHIERIPDGDDRRKGAIRLKRLIEVTLLREAPWAFTEIDWGSIVTELTTADDDVVDFVGNLVTKQLGSGDLLIVAEWRKLRQNLARHVDVDVWTLDGNLRAAVDHLRQG